MISFILFLMLTRTPAPDGKDVFLKYKCNNCHTVSTADIEAKTKTKAPDLADVTIRHKTKWIRKFIRQNETHTPCPSVESSLDGKKHPVNFKGTKEEEDALIELLDKQRTKK